VYQAGTLSGNPVAMSAGLVMLDEVSQAGFYEQRTSYTSRLLSGMKERANAAHVDFHTNQVGGMFGLFFTDQTQVTCFAETMACDGQKFSRFFHLMLENGVYLAPSAFEAGFVSTAHGEKELTHTLDAAERAFAQL
jgi:glutamate-1-semialdehyde 2,1-aminomutase